MFTRHLFLGLNCLVGILYQWTLNSLNLLNLTKHLTDNYKCTFVSDETDRSVHFELSLKTAKN